MSIPKRIFRQCISVVIFNLLLGTSLTITTSRSFAQEQGLAEKVAQKLESKINELKRVCPSERANQAQQSLINCAEKAPCDETDCPPSDDAWGQIIGCIEQCAARAADSCSKIIDLAIKNCQSTSLSTPSPTNTPLPDVKKIDVRPIRDLKILVSGIKSEEVFRQRPGGQWERLQIGTIELLEPGDRLYTANNSKVTLEYAESVNEETSSEVITVDSDTIIQIGESSENQTLILDSGEVRVRSDAPRNKQTRFDVLTPTANISVEGTDLVIRVAKDTSTDVLVKEGRVFVSDSKKQNSITLNSGQKIKVTPQELGKPMPLLPEDFQLFMDTSTLSRSSKTRQLVYFGVVLGVILIVVSFFVLRKILLKRQYKRK